MYIDPDRVINVLSHDGSIVAWVWSQDKSVLLAKGR